MNIAIAYNAGKDYEWVKKNSSIIHYVGGKPWSGDGFRYNIERVWWEYASLTPFYEELMENMIVEEMDLAYANTTVKRLSSEKQ